MNYNKLLNLASDLGCRLLESGAEISRVEDSVRRLIHAYGIPDGQVFAIPSCLFVGLNPPDEASITRMNRIPPHGTDLDQLELCNAMCRRLCYERPDLDEAAKLVASIPVIRPRYSNLIILLGHFLVAAFFTPFFSGGVMDALCGGLCGLAIGLTSHFFNQIAGSNEFFRTLLSSALSAILALLFVRMGIAQNTDATIVGPLMLLVPGIALTNAMREVMAGDIVSSLIRIAEALLTATAIALGTGAALMLGQLL